MQRWPRSSSPSCSASSFSVWPPSKNHPRTCLVLLSLRASQREVTRLVPSPVIPEPSSVLWHFIGTDHQRWTFLQLPHIHTLRVCWCRLGSWSVHGHTPFRVRQGPVAEALSFLPNACAIWQREGNQRIWTGLFCQTRPVDRLDNNLC